MKRYLTYRAPLLIFISLLISVLGCGREKYDPYYGPQDCAGNGVSYLSDFTISSNNVDFNVAGSKIRMQATLSSAAPWSVTIVGQLSNARKTYEGNSDVIDISWYGRPTGPILFVSEPVTITFNVRCRTDLIRTTDAQITMGNYTTDPELFMLTNFDGQGLPVASSSWLASPELDATYGDGVIDTAYCPLSVKSYCISPSPQGGVNLVFKGISAIPDGPSKNSYGTYEIYPPAGLNTVVSATPSDVWFNFYAHTNNTPVKVVVVFRNGANKLMGKKTLTLNTADWEMESINLADVDVTGAQAPMNPKNIEIILISVIQSGGIAPSYFGMDMVTFTVGESFLGTEY